MAESTLITEYAVIGEGAHAFAIRLLSQNSVRSVAAAVGGTRRGARSCALTGAILTG
jgi:hypothetical protein